MSAPDPVTVLQGQIADHLQRLVPTLDATQANDIVAAGVGRAPVWLHELERHLVAHPDAFSSGSAACPFAVVRLAWALLDAGHATVVPPGCARCRRPHRRLRWRTPQGRICPSCHDEINRRTCGRCGEHRPIRCRATATTPDLCESCNRATRPRVACGSCGNARICNTAPDGRPRCPACAPRPTHTCASCGQERPAQARWPIGPVCSSCYATIQANPAPCTGCRRERVLIGRDDQGNRVCGPCSGDRRDYACRSCQQPGPQHDRGMCARCVLRNRLQQALSGPDGQPTRQLQPVLDLLADTDSPESTLHQLRGPTGRLLAELAAAGKPITHDLLDELPPSRAELYIRSLLVLTGGLPARDENLERITPWLDRLLTGRPPHHATFIRPFAQWAVLRRARRNAAQRSFTYGAAGFARGRILIALEFLAWLDARQRPLSQLTQRDVDIWLTTGTTNRYNIRFFLNWARQRRLVTGITTPLRPREHPSDFLSDHEHWQQLHRCLTDEGMPLNLRVSGALILLFGVRLSRIVELRAGDITTTGDRTHLMLGPNPALLPPNFAAIVLRLAADPIHYSSLTRRHNSPTWLFPGKTPGRHLGTSHLGNELNRHGIDTHAGRNTALMALATDLPPAVLAELLGLGVTTAENWSHYAKRNWLSYLNARDTPTPNSAGSE